jgi:hypothetical protein
MSGRFRFGRSQRRPFSTLSSSLAWISLDVVVGIMPTLTAEKQINASARAGSGGRNPFGIGNWHTSAGCSQMDAGQAAAVSYRQRPPLHTMIRRNARVNFKNSESGPPGGGLGSSPFRRAHFGKTQATQTKGGSLPQAALPAGRLLERATDKSGRPSSPAAQPFLFGGRFFPLCSLARHWLCSS